MIGHTTNKRGKSFTAGEKGRRDKLTVGRYRGKYFSRLGGLTQRDLGERTRGKERKEINIRAGKGGT